ncbi:MAG: cache domain-containing protein [Sedimenticola sp.]|nr:cache domain-containing protein [Sedimenticola sp.]MCW8883228.1 cache domain-containing protein [Sedimenticola sp.]MCW8947922.1 cache domain-containing protein [Sedimenticola sp.]MCW8949669.1 cache domain-containing protein [Sedimenticola sp.]MCW8976449.1 cache domain-containing protein [Sedimenticola sp.]
MHPIRRLFSSISISNPFWLWVAICLLVGVSTAALIGILQTTDAVRLEAQKRFFEQYNQQQLTLAEQAAHSIEETFATFRRNLSLVASLFEDQGVTRERAQQLNNSLQRMYESLMETDIIDLVVFDAAGTVVAISPSDDYTLGRNYAWRDYYQWARDKGKPGQMYLSPFMRLEGGQNRGDKALIVAQGIYSKEGRFNGVAMFTLNFDKLAKRQILSVRIGEYGYAWLIDNNQQSVLVDPLGRVTDQGFKETFLPRWPKLYELLVSMQDGKPGTGTYEFVDPADPDKSVSKLVGYQPVRIEGRLWTLGVATPTREVDALLTSFMQQQERYSGTLVVIIFTGTFILLSALLSWNHTLSVQIERRTKDLAEARARLESTFDELLSSKKLAAVGHLALGLAHEIRNPLSAIRMNIQMIRKRSNAEGHLEEHFSIVEEEILRLNRLVNDVMDFARARPLRLERTSLNPIIHRVMQLFSQRFKSAQITTELQLNDELTVVCDPEQIEQVILNLVSNAIESLEESNGQRELSLIVRRHRPYLSLRVIDNGQGIAEADIDKVFDPFYTTKVSGGGLGLPTLQGIVLRHQGTITVDSVQGDKTCFNLLLPLDGPTDKSENKR